MNDGGVKLLAAVLGFWLIMRAISHDSSGRTLIDHLLGQQGNANQALGTLTPPGSAASPIGTPNAKGQVNPVPGSTGTWLDQGIDLTGKTFVAPYAGTVVASQISDPGWKGGGYVAIANAADPSQVEYFAEGLYPLVTQGQKVVAGQGIARPAANPYNGIIGNIETGPANPANPRQPLAQVASNPAAAVTGFLTWLRGLGGPTATAGHVGTA